MSKLLIWHHPPTAQTSVDDVEQVSSVRRLYFYEQRARGSLAKVLTCYGCVLPCLFVSVLFSARLLVCPFKLIPFLMIPQSNLTSPSYSFPYDPHCTFLCLSFCRPHACIFAPHVLSLGASGNLLWMWSFVPSQAWVLKLACGWCGGRSQVRISALSLDSDIMFVILFGLIVQYTLTSHFVSSSSC